MRLVKDFPRVFFVVGGRTIGWGDFSLPLLWKLIASPPAESGAQKKPKKDGGEEVGDSFGEATVVVGEKLWHFVREEGETFF